MQSNYWLLPEGVQEAIPPQSWHLEAARRELIDLYWRWGFDLIRPSLIEYLDSLLAGPGQEMDLHTFKLTDQISGRMMGVRSDMTTQATRIDAHRLAATGPARYCYIGTVLKTRADEPGGSRSPLQIGAEKFGDTHLHADLEVMSLMLESLSVLGIEQPYMDLGHVAIYRSLIEDTDIATDFEPTLFDIIQRKSRPDLNRLASEGRIDVELHRRLMTLMDLAGPADELLTQALETLSGVNAQIDKALQELSDTVALLREYYPDIPLYLDLAELRGYRYKTGLIFAAFVPGLGRELARGGRYDHRGAVPGGTRPATGFSADLNLLVSQGHFSDPRPAGGILSPPSLGDPALVAEIRRLRQVGERVIETTPAHTEAEGSGCDRILEKIDGVWHVRPL